MAASIGGQCCGASVVRRREGGDFPRRSGDVESHRLVPSAVVSATARDTTAAAPSMAMEGKGKSSNDAVSSGHGSRWAAAAAVAAAASIAVLSAAPAVSAGELPHAVPGDLSLSMAIPIPDPDTWTFSQYGFVAPPPRGGEVAAVSVYQGGCPPWQPSQFEMIVPDGVHPKHGPPRHGTQWPALYMLDEASVQYSAVNSADPSVKYASLIDALLRMSDSGLTCFSL